METAVKQRLIGALVLVLLAFIFLPILFSRPDVKEPDAANVPLDMPAAPDQKFETHDLPLAAPDTHTPAGGVLGMQQAPAPTAPATDPNAMTTVDQSATPAPNPDNAAVAPAPVAAVPPVASAPAPAAKPAAAPPTPAPAVATGPAEAAGNYAVNVGSFGNLDNANALVARLKSQKLPVMSDKLQIDGKPALRVRVGPYVDRSTAEAARQKVEGVVGEALKVIALDGAAPAPAAAVAKPAAAAPAPTAPVAAKPAPATSPAAAPTNAASTGFAVQLAAPSVEADAIALRDRARALGFSAFVQRVETAAGVRFRVRVGPETDRATAEKDRDAVAQKLGITGLVVPHP